MNTNKTTPNQSQDVFEMFFGSSSLESDQFQPPGTWTTGSDDDGKKILFEVTQHEDEYWIVQEKLQESMKNAYISKLWRIQNEDQWANYVLQNKVRLETLQGTPTREQLVWHDTSNLDPSAIYRDKQDGFMMQHAKQGLWG